MGDDRGEMIKCKGTAKTEASKSIPPMFLLSLWKSVNAAIYLFLPATSFSLPAPNELILTMIFWAHLSL